MNHCAIIYGALPPETKKTQAFLFNNRMSDVKFLVATDAVSIILKFTYIDWYGTQFKHLKNHIHNCEQNS